MPNPRQTRGSYDQIAGAREARESATTRGPGGIPLSSPIASGERLIITRDPSIPEPETPEVSHYFQDTGEAVEALEACPDREHSWWRAGGKDWIASSGPRPSTAGRLRLERGERVLITRIEQSTGTREEVRVATLADRETHLAGVARAQHLSVHPEQGDYVFEADLPAGGPADVGEIIAAWRARTLRPVVLGGRVSLQRPAGGSWGAQIGPDDEALVLAYEPLIVAELEGAALPCSVPACPSPARAMAKVRVPICLEHLALPVGAEPVKPGRIRAALGAITAAVAG